MREYETTFIVQPEISDEGSQAILSRLDGILESGGATRLMCEDHGKRKLAYEVRKFHKGHYYTLMFLDEGRVVPDLERAIRLEESILRFLTIQAEEEVVDIEARKTVASEAEDAQTKRAEERAVREAEEATARLATEEAEREASLQRAAEEAKAAAAADTPQGEGGEASSSTDDVATAEAKASESEAAPEPAAPEPKAVAEDASSESAAAEATKEKS